MPERTVAVLHALATAPPGGVLFHCAAGRDRTGLIAAILLTAADVEPEAIVTDYLLPTLAQHRAARVTKLPRPPLAPFPKLRGGPPLLAGVAVVQQDEVAGKGTVDQSSVVGQRVAAAG